MTLPRARDALVPFLIGALARALVVLWGAKRFPPIDDGHFYHVLAERLAGGHGYTWLWADGSVTFVAHYPVGYPALISLAYRVFGAAPWAAMAENAVLGAIAVLAVHGIAATRASRAGALLAAFAVALHPALLFYTPALMTEGVTAALVAVAGYFAVRARGSAHFGFIVALGVLLGFATLVRGQTLLLAPLFGAIAAYGRRGVRSSALAAGLTTLIAIAIVSPWTLRNCQKMDRCVAVSANLGWNLLIGTNPNADGTFAPVDGETVPVACRSVFGEADKDACFARAALGEIREHPGRWLALIPKKLAHTFDPGGTAAWYLAGSNGDAFRPNAQHWLAGAETLWQRALVLFGLVALAEVTGPRRRIRIVFAALFGLALVTPFAWLSYLGLAILPLLFGRRALEHPPAALAAAAIVATALTHAVFFGAGRYAMPVFALSAALAGSAFGRREGEARAF